MQGLLDSPVAVAALGPSEQLDQFVTREGDPRIREVAPSLRHLDQADQDLVVEGCRQAVLRCTHDRQSADDRRAVATLQPVLEDEGELTVRYPIGQRRDREFGQVQLVFPTTLGRVGVPYIPPNPPSRFIRRIGVARHR